MKKSMLVLSILALMLVSSCKEQETKDNTKNDTLEITENTKVVLITLDGLRWQELFTGADPKLVAHETYVHDSLELKELFWREEAAQRREALMPFVWTKVKDMGQIHGNRTLGSQVDLTNTMWFSYPGYNEILTGAADDERIDSNDKMNNPNTTVLEIANSDPRYAGKVAAFGSWDVFPFIVNESRSGVPVNAGYEAAKGDDLTDRELLLNELQATVPKLWGTVRYDAFTHNYLLEQLKKTHPELVYISYGETDDFAHDGDYEAYLKSAHTTDGFIGELWDFTQQDPFYKDNTVFLITTDHGRGTVPLDTWRSHGSDIEGAGSTWFIAFGKGVTAKGELKESTALFTNQIAPTIAKVLDLSEGTQNMKGAPIPLNE